MGSSDERFNLLFMAQDAASGVIDSISGRLGKMALAFAGVGAAGAFLKSAIAEAAESQRVFAQLGATIERHGGSWKEAEAGVRSFATTLMLTTGESDEAIAASIKMFIDYGASGAQAYERVALAIDIARSKNIDLETVTQALARAQIGATRGLIQLGLKMDEATLQGMGFAEIMARLRELHGGAAAEDMKTYAGQVRALGEAWGEFKDQSGGPIIEMLTGYVRGLNDLNLVLNSNMSTMEQFSFVANLAFQPAWRWMDLIGAAAKHARAEMGALGGGIEGVGEVLGPATAELERSKEMLKEWTDAAEKATKKSEALFASWMERRNQMLEGMAPWEGRGGIFRFGEQPGEVLGPETSELYRSRFMIEEKAHREYAEKIKEQQEEMARFITGVTSNAMNAIVDQFMQGRIRLAQVFKGMARDFISYFLQEIAKRAGASIAARLFGGALGFIAGGPVGAAEGVVVGGSLGKMAPNSGTTSPASAPIIVINVPMRVTQEYVRNQVIPELKRLQAAGAY